MVGSCASVEYDADDQRQVPALLQRLHLNPADSRFSYNAVLSFIKSSDCKTVVVRLENICDNCNGAKPTAQNYEVTLVNFPNGLSEEQQRAALIHLPIKWFKTRRYAEFLSINRCTYGHCVTLSEAISVISGGSYRENCDCPRAIKRAISGNYQHNSLDDCIQPIIDRYSFDHVICHRTVTKIFFCCSSFNDFAYFPAVYKH